MCGAPEEISSNPGSRIGRGNGTIGWALAEGAARPPLCWRRSVRGVEVGLACALGEEEGMEFVHESVIQRSKVLETLRAGLLQPLEEVDLGARIELFQELGELGH